MTKNEVLHALLDRILEIEATSKKGVSFQYSNDFLHLYFREGVREGAYIGDSIILCTEKDIVSSLDSINQKIDLIKNTPDIEPKVSILLTKERAIELGLMGLV